MKENNNKALVPITQCVQNANTFANTLFAFVFTTASTSSAVRLLLLSCNFFNPAIHWVESNQ